MPFSFEMLTELFFRVEFQGAKFAVSAFVEGRFACTRRRRRRRFTASNVTIRIAVIVVITIIVVRQGGCAIIVGGGAITVGGDAIIVGVLCSLIRLFVDY